MANFVNFFLHIDIPVFSLPKLYTPGVSYRDPGILKTIFRDSGFSNYTGIGIREKIFRDPGFWRKHFQGSGN